MGSGTAKKGGGGDRVVEGRHLIGAFLGVVVLCGVFFTLGYVMGRTQPDSGLALANTAGRPASHVTPSSAKAEKNAAPGVSTPSEWDFYPTSTPEKASGPAVAIAKPTPAAEPSAKFSTATKRPAKGPVASRLARFKPPLIPGGAYVLQVAALVHDNDALALADALQQKKYPAFVLAPASDNLYRVQVGPYADGRSAEIAKRSLEREGFKTILKR